MTDTNEFTCYATTGVRAWVNEGGDISLVAERPEGDDEQTIIAISKSDAGRLAAWLETVSRPR